MTLDTRAMTRVALMVAVMAVSAQIAIPLPFSPIPFTLQVMGVILSGLLLGPKYGALSQVVYLLIGAVGVPVFAQFSGGFGSLVGPSGGYLLSYPLAAALAGLAAYAAANSPRGRALAVGFIWGCAALAVIYALGATQLALVTRLPASVAVAQGVLPFVVFDLVKIGLAAAIATAAAPVIASSRA